MATITVTGISPQQEAESDDAFERKLGPIPTDDKGDPLYTKREWRDECIYRFFKSIITQDRTTQEEKTKIPHNIAVETAYGKIDKGP